MKAWQRRTKRAIDILVAALGLVMLSPVLSLVAIAIWISMGRPVFFRQTRPGLHGNPFEIVKFRTMRDLHDAEGRAMTDEHRLTRLGRFLRKTSLDELPELWNVLVGQLSLVGPRPLLMRYLPHLTEREMQRHTVRPGITGWAQIHGRNEASWDDRLQRDYWYVENWSLLLDFRILFMTITQVASGTGVVVSPTSQMQDLDQERAKPVEPSASS